MVGTWLQMTCLIADVKIFFQWVPSHVNVCGIEIVDGLAFEDIHKDSARGGCLTFPEIATRKQDISSSWRQTHVYEWYGGNYPGASLLGRSSRRD
ncbi:uncharacterized protein TNCV_1191751 [Trichonephila clavipes]|nr:uncharacterized protein TNCV_1191751 [Trichonephila clavipes]